MARIDLRNFHIETRENLRDMYKTMKAIGLKGMCVTAMVPIVMVLLLSTSCKQNKVQRRQAEEPINGKNAPYAVESEPWGQLFIRNEGWFGGDGIFGIPMDGKEFVPASDSTVTLFTFGDTMVGKHDGTTLLTENFEMINNSIGLLKGKEPDPDQITFHYKTDAKGRAQALFVPNVPSSKPGDYYWLGDGFVNVEGDGKLYIFAYPVHEKDTTGIGGFGFEQIGVNLLAIPIDSKPPYSGHQQLETPFFDAASQTSFGSAIYVNTVSAGAPNPDGFVYTYAVSNREKTKGLLVARVPSMEYTQFDRWRFWNGNGWAENMGDAEFIAQDVSNEMSVSPLADGRILITYQYYTMSPEVAVQIGESLVGPFGGRQTIYTTPEAEKGKTYFTYNAKAYPHLSSLDSTLISYNVNTFDFFEDILKDPNLYRPRFIQAPIK